MTVPAATYATLVALEIRRPLRPDTERKLRRNLRNLGIAATAGLVAALLEQPLVQPIARRSHARGTGLVPRLRLPRPAGTLLSLALMDYTLFIWHVLAHRVPLLWRFHAVHHADADLDASTALRFHGGEIALSIPWRMAQVAVLGVSPRTLRIWQSLTLVSILFHHSNVRLPWRLERFLSWLVATPRMHRIHHSLDPVWRDSNWSSGLAVWDRLHRTFRLHTPPAEGELGVPGLTGPTIGRMLLLPILPDAPGRPLDGGHPAPKLQR